MKITKYGHCCLFIEEKNLRILTDPGNYSTLQNNVTGVDVILITHEHADHFHIESLKQVLKNNPKVKIVTNKGVAVHLDKEKIAHILLEDGQSDSFGGVKIEGFGAVHALIHEEWLKVQNTGYLIADRLFYPGDAFYDPKRPVDILALPVAGPWMKIGEAIDYAITLKPKVAFPVHDGGLKSSATVNRVSSGILPKHGIEFVVIEEGKTVDFA